jgi:hypothetical protein
MTIKLSSRALCTATFVLLAVAGCATPPASIAIAPSQIAEKGKPMTTQANGEFEVKLSPQPADVAPAGETISRMLLDKKFHGPLDATSKGQMLAVRTKVTGSAGYVAMEMVVGSLDGKSGSFVLQHSGTMNRGVPLLALSVVPDSGSGELAGIAGNMEIIIAEGKHSYRFEYSLPK